MKLFETVTKENVYQTFQSTFNELKVRDKRFQIQVGEKIWNDLNEQRNLYHDILGESLVQLVGDYKKQQSVIQEVDTNFKMNPSFVYANIMECIFNGVSDTLVFNKMMNELISWLSYVEILNAAVTKKVKV